MRSFINSVITSAVALATVATLGIPLLFATPAQAACYSVYWPRLTSNYTYTYPPGSWPGHDGWKFFQIGYRDDDRKLDYAGHRIVVYFTNGQSLNISGPSWSANYPPHYTIGRIDLADVNSCGVVVAWRRQ